MCCLIWESLRKAGRCIDHEVQKASLVVVHLLLRGSAVHIRRIIVDGEVLVETLNGPWFEAYAEEGESYHLHPYLQLGTNQPHLGMFASTILRQTLVQPKESAAAQKLILWWLAQCDSKHEDCSTGISGETISRASTVLPTRLVQVDGPSGPCLVVTEGKLGRYVTLSHRWGGEGVTRTTKSTLEDYTKVLPFADLPKTFRDAIQLTRSLGIAYIWIDSLCIVQDDHEDWLRESRQMGGVYERSYLTIAATSGVNGNSGLFKTDRPPYLRFPCSPTSPEAGWMYFSLPAPPIEEDIDHAPLNKRGWVLQERILSKRTLHFAASQIYWECRKTIAAQSNHNSGPASWDWRVCRVAFQKFHIPASDPNHRLQPYHDKFHQIWTGLVEYYSSRALTRTQDRLIAIEGIRERLHNTLGFPCPAGHWLDTQLCFIKSLAWAVCEHHIHPFEDEEVFRAPTWSCFAAEHTIWYPPGMLESREWAVLDLEDYGMSILEVSDTHLRVKGFLPIWQDGLLSFDDMTGTEFDIDFYPPFAAFRDLHEVNSASISPQACVVLFKDEPLLAGWVRLDLPGSAPSISYCLCPLYVAKNGIPCLLLQETAANTGTFERRGLAIICGHNRAERTNVWAAIADWLKGCERTEFLII